MSFKSLFEAQRICLEFRFHWVMCCLENVCYQDLKIILIQDLGLKCSAWKVFGSKDFGLVKKFVSENFLVKKKFRSEQMFVQMKILG